MNEILLNFQNPAWWFTALIMAIIASLIAGFIKDWIPDWLSRGSRYLRRRSYRKRRILAKNIRVLVSSPQLHNSYSHKVNRYLIVALVLPFMIFGLGPLHLFYENYSIYDPLNEYAFNLGPKALGIQTIVMAVFLIPINFLLASQLSILRLTHRKLRKQAIRQFAKYKAN